MTPTEVVRAFNAAVDRRDVPSITGLLSEDAVFESTGAPDGVRFEGRQAIADFWTRFFVENPGARFHNEEEFTVDDRVVTRWRYEWSSAGHVRGVDLFRVSGSFVSEKLSYVKG